jgi:hypothetical protein
MNNVLLTNIIMGIFGFFITSLVGLLIYIYRGNLKNFTKHVKEDEDTKKDLVNILNRKMTKEECEIRQQYIDYALNAWQNKTKDDFISIKDIVTNAINRQGKNIDKLFDKFEHFQKDLGIKFENLQKDFREYIYDKEKKDNEYKLEMKGKVTKMENIIENFIINTTTKKIQELKN